MGLEGSSLVETLPVMCMALGLIFSTEKKKKRKKERNELGEQLGKSQITQGFKVCGLKPTYATIHFLLVMILLYC
jgi:hypothetical protein